MADKLNMLFVGPRDAYNALSNMDDNWNLQIPISNIEQLNRELESEDSEISSETQTILLLGRLFHDNPEDFANDVAFYAPYTVLCIMLCDNDEPNLENDIRKAVKDQQFLLAEEDETYNANAPFYFIRYEDPYYDIIDSIKEWSMSPVVEQESASDVKKVLEKLYGPLNDEYAEEINYERDYMDNSTGLGSYDDSLDEILDDDMMDIPSGEKDDGFVISITSSKGGSGKSTVAITLAAFLAYTSLDAVEQGKEGRPLNVCIVDMDTRDGQQWILSGAKKPPTVMDIMGTGSPTYNTVDAGIWHSDKIKCDFVFAPKRPRSAVSIPPSFYAQLIKVLKYKYDVVILDNSVNYLDPLGEEVAYPLSDFIVFVTDMVKTSVLGCTRWIKEEMDPSRGEKAIPREKVGVVINKAMKEVNMPIDQIRKSIDGLEILAAIPNFPNIITYASNISETQRTLRNPLIADAMRDLATSIFPMYDFGEIPENIL